MNLDIMDKVRKYLSLGLILIAAVYALSLFIGGPLFNLDGVVIAGWFTTVLVLVFGVVFIGALIAFIIYFLGKPYFPLFVLIGALGIVVLFVLIFVKLTGGSIADLGMIFDPIFSFLK